MKETEGPEFARLLDYLRVNRSFDFSGYKMSSLMRRVRKRMTDVGTATYGDYIDYLEVHPDEFGPLFNTVLINVTGFFRDSEAWRFLAEQVLPRVIQDKEGDGAIRVWSAGCASGQEAYSIAMLLAESLGDEVYRRRVKIYATDADEEALAQARQASYDDHQVADVPPDLLARYFEPLRGRHVFRSDLRRSLIFGRHDLVQDAAISRVELLVCRNTLMYFNSETQAKILARFHFAVAPNGYLFLGKAETLLSRSESFRPLDLKHRMFQRTLNNSLRDRLLAINGVAGPVESQAVRQGKLREATFESGPVAQLVVDRDGYLVLANERARRLFRLGKSDLGRLLHDLEVSYRPVDLRSAIDEVSATRASVRIDDIAWPAGLGESLEMEVQAAPIFDEGGEVRGTSIAFIDLTQSRVLKRELERTNQELEAASEELQSANEELETTNEELQSTVEELETTNEELQSANEELETMNEELQSTNEELRTINDQLHQSADDLNRMNDLVDSILGRLADAVVVLDGDLSVSLWSRRAEALWGLRSDEVVGTPFFSLELGIPLAPLRPIILDNLDKELPAAAVSLDGVDRRGRPIQCRVSCRRLDGTTGGSRVLVLMEEIRRGQER